MTIRMLVTAYGSEDGFSAKIYEMGAVYEVGEALAASFVASERAEPAPAPSHRQRAKK